ncbi:hypothetical protein PSECIP111854_00144 [Pseudoalteromonas sp. CIP111854]|uniref:Uncharacterized protein n=1 Tax=Pseudoalteromonas holothuriae TaxID=2963714 RepID=A0A9W4VM61_9GAMM|nr:hypothetical protein [Pseudoalteromonas sp. CIP111854]CAH9049510.1 hypothetical protein PSECIP111854_00144 [Pseudoalteromonas sp. CIP111854]
MSWFNPFKHSDNQSAPASSENNTVPRFNYFNATGNILISSVCPPNQPLPEAVQSTFNQGAAFVASAMRAVSTTINPVTNQPYSIFNHFALSRVLAGSGHFTKLSEQSLTLPNTVFSNADHCQLFSSLFNINFSSACIPFAQALTTQFAQHANEMAARSHPTELKTAHLVLCCEYISGLACVSVVLISLNNEQHQVHLAKRPCLNNQHRLPDWTIEKEHFLYQLA